MDVHPLSFHCGLQNQLHDRDQKIHHLEQTLEEREQQLRASQMQANEAVSQCTSLRAKHDQYETAVKLPGIWYYTCRMCLNTNVGRYGLFSPS